MKTYTNVDTEEKVEAVQWNGESALFHDWTVKLGELPFSYLDFPRIRIQNTPSRTEFVFYASIGDWIVKTKDNFFISFKDKVFKLRYKENNFFFVS